MYVNQVVISNPVVVTDGSETGEATTVRVWPSLSVKTLLFGIIWIPKCWEDSVIDLNHPRQLGGFVEPADRRERWRDQGAFLPVGNANDGVTVLRLHLCKVELNIDYPGIRAYISLVGDNTTIPYLHGSTDNVSLTKFRVCAQQSTGQ